MKKFEEMIKNKKIIIIGPASYLKDNPIAKNLEDYDTVIRINSSIDLTEKIPHIVGTRTDIVHATVAVDPSTNTNHRKVDFWINKKIKHLRISPPPIRPSWSNNIKIFEQINKNRLHYSVVDSERYHNFQVKCGNTVPNTGFTAILDCLAYDPAQIHVSGITFFKGGYMPEYGVTTVTEEQVRNLFSTVRNHNIDNQIEYFRYIFYENKITCDKYIKETLKL